MVMLQRFAARHVFVSGACAVLLIVLVAPVLFSLFFPDAGVCIPGRSIKCHEGDCSRQYVRCGKYGVEDVPEGMVCYGGRLVPVERSDLYSCPSFEKAAVLNITTNACNCNFCTSNRCNCICATTGVSSVFCPSTGRFYPSLAVANCCGANSDRRCVARGGFHCVQLLQASNILMRFEFSRQLVGQIASVAESFTFPSPPLAVNTAGTSCCSSACCINVC